MKECYNLTDPQKSIWFTEQLYKGTNISNISGTVKINRKVNFKALEEAAKLLVKDNEALRTKIFMDKNNIPKQYFMEYKDFNVDLVNVENEVELNILINKLSKKPFTCNSEYLFRFTMFRFPDGKGGCNIIYSHLISDAWTTTLICNRFIDNYKRILNNENLESEQFSYVSYIKDEEKYVSSEKYIKDKEYWQEKYSKIPELATLSNKTNKKLDSSANRLEFKINSKKYAEITEFCKDNKISIYTFFMSIYSIYISRITKLDKIILGTPILNRRNVKEKNTIGMYVSTIPMDINVNEQKTAIQLFDDTTKEIMKTFRHQRYPYIKLLQYIREKFNVNRGLYDVIISYQNAKTKAEESVIPYVSSWQFNGNISETLNIHILDVDNTKRLNIFYDYQTSKLTKEEVENIHKRILYIIEQIIKNKEILIENIDIVTKEEKKIIEKLNKTDAQYPKNKTVTQLFEEQVRKTPDKIAVCIDNKKITYKELNKQANKLAHFLIKKGIKQDMPVAIRINKSIEMIIGIIAIIKAGGCYLPIDLSYPEERVKFMLKDSKAKVLLTNSKCINNCDMNLDIEIINLDNKSIYSKDSKNLKTVNKPDDLLYIIYTSGSTGTPKGAMITHKNVVRLMKNNKFLFDFSEKDIWTMFHSVAFDFSVWEMYGALLYGGKLVLVPENIAKSPKQFLDLLRKEKVTILNQTPTFFYNLLDQEIKEKDNNLKVRYIIFGGEALKPNLIKPWKNKYKSTKLINMYGITETTVHVTFKELSDNDLLSDKSNIGVPIPTLKTYILDEKLRMLPVGIEGEICVAGDGVCRGYLNREELNKIKFVDNPYKKGEKLYRSADSAVLGEDGNLYYKGRIDNQVKIRGFRVELGEIETKLLRHPKISKCVVLEDKKSDKDSHLVAYIVCNGDVKIEELKEYMKSLVPVYMIPNYFVKLDDLPINSNGKIDRKALKNTRYTIEKETKYEAPRNDFEKCLKKIIEEEMQIQNVGINDDILNLGADSLTLMRIVSKLLENNYEVSIQKFYEQKTIKQINNTLNSQNNDVDSLEANLYYKFENKEHGEKISFNNILLTGATGFLGIHILHDIIKNTNANVYCLIRDKENTDAKTRLINKLKFYFNDEMLEYMDNRISVIKGDITKERLGLEEEQYKSIGYKIDLAIHSAAIVNHYGKKEIFELVNITGTNNIIKFCKDFNIKLNYISTISVSADFIMNRNITEEFNEHSLYIGQDYKKNIYVRTKFEAEYNLYKEMEKGLKVATYRLGNITARITDGKFQENDYQNAFLNRILSLIKLGKTTEELLKYEFDMSPVDECSYFITQIMQYENSYNRVFHIINNNQINLKQLLDNLNLKNLTVVSGQELKEIIKKEKNKLGLINDITNNASINKFIKINSDESIRYLNNLNLAWKKIDKKYLQNTITKYLNI